jgi:hypothetical protein
VPTPAGIAWLSECGERAAEREFAPAQFAALLGSAFLLQVACDVLRKANFLIFDRNRRSGTNQNQTKRKLAGKRQRVYCLSAKLLDLDQSGQSRRAGSSEP